MHLARVAAGVRELAPGVPQVFAIDPDDVVKTAIDTTFAYVVNPSANGHHEGAARKPKARQAASRVAGRSADRSA
jgi:hypothetical protein